MKKFKSFILIVFSLVILLPCVLFNFEENAISDIDNRMLADNPFTTDDGDFSTRVDNYVNDRIGLRDEMIYGYTMFNDLTFGKLTHPSFIRGKEDYIFGTEAIAQVKFEDYHKDFAKMVFQIQTYCDQRNIPFVFVINPSKSSVLSEYLPQGVYKNRQWVTEFCEELDRLGVCYIDNATVLREQTAAGEAVFNRQYDANHWNAWGAYYGTNEILKVLASQMDGIHINQKEELSVAYKTETQLPNSNYPIQEDVPQIKLNTKTTSLYERYNQEVERHPSYQGFNYFVNEQRKAEGAPKALVFQGSYMNGQGYPYLANAFGEYIYVHDYQNVMDFAYYYNIFQPDCVVFEVAEYTFTEGYFSRETMQQMKLNPLRASVEDSQLITVEKPTSSLSVQQGACLTKIYYATDTLYRSAWLTLDCDYDMKVHEKGYVVTVPNEVYEVYQDKLTITFQK